MQFSQNAPSVAAPSKSDERIARQQFLKVRLERIKGFGEMMRSSPPYTVGSLRKEVVWAESQFGVHQDYQTAAAGDNIHNMAAWASLPLAFSLLSLRLVLSHSRWSVCVWLTFSLSRYGALPTLLRPLAFSLFSLRLVLSVCVWLTFMLMIQTPATAIDSLLRRSDLDTEAKQIVRAMKRLYTAIGAVKQAKYKAKK